VGSYSLLNTPSRFSSQAANTPRSCCISRMFTSFRTGARVVVAGDAVPPTGAPAFALLLPLPNGLEVVGVAAVAEAAAAAAAAVDGCRGATGVRSAADTTATGITGGSACGVGAEEGFDGRAAAGTAAGADVKAGCEVDAVVVAPAAPVTALSTLDCATAACNATEGAAAAAAAGLNGGGGGGALDGTGGIKIGSSSDRPCPRYKPTTALKGDSSQESKQASK
jgi:hypothetical protein